MAGARARAACALAFVAVACVSCGPRPAGEDATPIDVSLPPGQGSVEGAEPVRVSDGGWEFVITPLASYVLRGVVVSRESYHLDWNTGLSPCDVAMVWGELAAGDAWRRLEWSQGGRWYFWRWSGEPPFPTAMVVRTSSNTHIVPASSNLGRAARRLSEGDVAELSGELVEISGRKGEQWVKWRSSLSRDDTGNGSCELLYLRRLRVSGRVYE